MKYFEKKSGFFQSKKCQQFLFLAIFSLYFIFLFLDFFKQAFTISNWIKWGCIWLIAILQTTYRQTPMAWRLAAWLTVFCDYSLLFNFGIPLGLICFCLVHLLRIYTHEKKYLNICLQVSLFFLIIGLIFKIFFWGILLDYTFLLFFTSFLIKRKENKRLIWGYFLFIACDFCVLLANFPINSTVNAAILSWLFYLPSQFLLVTDKKTKISF